MENSKQLWLAKFDGTEIYLTEFNWTRETNDILTELVNRNGYSKFYSHEEAVYFLKQEVSESVRKLNVRLAKLNSM